MQTLHDREQLDNNKLKTDPIGDPILFQDLRNRYLYVVDYLRIHYIFAKQTRSLKVVSIAERKKQEKFKSVTGFTSTLHRYHFYCL